MVQWSVASVESITKVTVKITPLSDFDVAPQRQKGLVVTEVKTVLNKHCLS